MESLVIAALADLLKVVMAVDVLGSHLHDLAPGDPKIAELVKRARLALAQIEALHIADSGGHAA